MILLWRHIKEVLNYLNKGDENADRKVREDNTNGGFNMTLWVFRAHTQDRVANNQVQQGNHNQNDRNFQQLTVASGSIKYNINYMVPLCTDETFMLALELLKLDNNIFWWGNLQWQHSFLCLNNKEIRDEDWMPHFVYQSPCLFVFANSVVGLM